MFRPVLERGSGDRLDLVGRDHGGQTLADRFPAVIGCRAREQFRLGVGEDVGLARHRLHARLFLELVQDALLHRHRQADRAEFLIGEAGGEGLLAAPGAKGTLPAAVSAAVP